MSAVKKDEGLLSPYRVLDLTDEKGLLCGKLLGDLGADVIKIEKPGGDPARHIGPFYHDEVDPEKSLFWFAYNTNKRGITLNIESDEGKATFKQLVKTGPHATHPGFGPHLIALSGFCHITGWPDGPPSEIGVYTDLICPYFIGLSAIAALDYRRRTGKGQFFDMAQYENAIH